MRNKDNPQVDMTTGLERVLTWDYFPEITSAYRGWGITDARESGYVLADLAYDAALDTNPTLTNFDPWTMNTGSYTNPPQRLLPDDPTFRSITWANASAMIIANLVDPNAADYPWYQQDYGNWNYLYTGQAADGDYPVHFMSSGYSSVVSTGSANGTVSLVNGSPTVTGVGTTWDCTNANLGAGSYMWFWHNGATLLPANNAAGDPSYYSIASCTNGTPQTITLTSNYTGATCPSCGYEANSFAVGFGNMPYQTGILDRALHYMASAVAKANPTASANARTLAVKLNNWIINNGYIPASHGFAYWAGYLNCASPITIGPGCFGGGPFTVSQSLGYSAEVMDALASTYQYNSDSTAKTVADAMYNQMWANPKVPCSSPCDNTATVGAGGVNYMSQFDTSLGYGVAFMLGGTPPEDKWFGQYFGFGDYSAWPAVRLGGVAATTTRTVYVGFNLAGVANAAKVVVTVTDADGTGSSTVCTTSPCAVTAPRADQPGYSIQMQYQTATGTILASSSQPVMWAQ
jgi:hypothetical protein